MSVSEALLNILNNDEEPFAKRLKIADNAFKTSEFQFHHKEALLLEWIVNNTTQFSHEELWRLVNEWLSSKEFKDLTQNDITNDDIRTIIELFQNKLVEKNLSILEKQQLIKSVLYLCENRAFQQFFKYATELYCKIISLSLEVTELPLECVDFITKPFLFPKNVLLQESFPKHFLEIVYPQLVKTVGQHQGNSHIFEETVRVIQKCILLGRIKHFENFFDQQLDTQNDETYETQIPKAVFKHLALTLQKDNSTVVLSGKLFFSAFTESIKDPIYIFKFLIYLANLLQFDISKDFNVRVPFKRKISSKLSQSLDILVEILGVISTKNVTDCSISNISFIEFLRNILRLLVSLDLHNSVAFEIILNCILVNPLVIEPIASEIIVFAMLGNNEKMKENYEKLVIAIFEVFAKLRRVESFIAKIIPALKSAIVTKNQLKDKCETMYSFKGEQDIKIASEKQVCAKDIFTENILTCFTRCLNGLASWQIINVFKTLQYHVRNAVEEYASDNFSNDPNELIYLEMLGILTTCLLQSVKIADHTVPQNVVTKFVTGLEELKDILKDFGPAILKRHHNHIVMRTFLNLCYIWAEVYITLTYYSINNEVKVTTVTDKIYSAANLKYLHSYMGIKEWQLIAQRITNFGEYPCKKLLQKLYVQKLRAMLLLEKNLNEDIATNVVKTLQSHLDDTWQDILLDKFTVNFVLPKMDKTPLVFLAEQLMEIDNIYEKNHIMDSVTLTNATIYVVMSKINKLFRIKRKHGVEHNKNISSEIFALCPEEVFFSREDYNMNEVFDRIKDLHENWQSNNQPSIINKEDKLLKYLSVLRKAPFIYSSPNIQKIILLYLFSLSMTVLTCSDKVRIEVEDLIIGTLQASKFPLTDIFKIKYLCVQALINFQRCGVFSIIVDNVFKHEKSIVDFEPVVLHFVKTLEDPKHLRSSILILQAVNKVKKSKFDSTTKEKANQYKEKIIMKLSKFVCKSDYLIEAYALCLKYYLSVEKDTDTLKMLLDKLGSYIEYSLNNISEENQKGSAILFTTVLQNKSKIQSIDSDIVLKIWNACKKVSIGDEYSHLIHLIVTLIPNDEFEMLVTDLFNITETSIKSKDYFQLTRQLKTLESILTCDMNPTKMKIWQEVLEHLTYELLHILKNTDYSEDLYKSIIHLENSIIQAQHLILSPPLIDIFIMTISVVMRHEDEHFESVFRFSISTLEALLKYRHAIVMDRLPAFLQQYRVLLKSITSKSNTDDDSAQKLDIKTVSDCVHCLEKLTKTLGACKKDMGRIAVFLIADILERYEQINLYPNVKLHLNNCIYSLMSLCDHHAVSYSMRTLSNASREMFKIMYGHYKKYYMFTGKV